MDVDATATYLEHRSLLFSIAYRMTGSVEDAEDITSEVFLRYRRALESGTAIETPLRVPCDDGHTTRHRPPSFGAPQPRDVPRSVAARAARGEHRVRWRDARRGGRLALDGLPRRLGVADAGGARRPSCYERCSSTTTRTSPRSSGSPRPIAHSWSGAVNLHIADRKPRFEASSAVRDRIARTFFSAVEHGDLEPLVDVLAADVVAYGDGGGVDLHSPSRCTGEIA